MPQIVPARVSADAAPPRSTSRLARCAVPIGIGLAIFLLPAPAGLSGTAWHYFALFVGIVAALILEPLPAAGVGFVGMAAAAASRLVAPDPGESLKWALSGFANGTVWLVFGAFMFALGYEKTGLGRRIALVMVKKLGGRTLGLGYAVTFADTVLAPFTPSNTARSAGTIFPIIANIPPLYDSHPGPSARRIGAYVMWVSFAATCITSSVFASALAPNFLAIELVQKTTGEVISMPEWLAGSWPMGVVLIGLMPLVAFWLYPPQIAGSPEVPKWAARELAAMGPISRSEILWRRWPAPRSSSGWPAATCSTRRPRRSS